MAIYMYNVYNDRGHLEYTVNIDKCTGLNQKETGHHFRGMCIKLLCTIGNVVFLLTQWVDLGVYCSVWQMHSN